MTNVSRSDPVLILIFLSADCKNFSAESDEMNLRRISYLMATKDDRMQPGSDIEEEEEEFIQITSTDSRR
jgi:hypothetical protein